jgi:FkbM family methyltransferase
MRAVFERFLYRYRLTVGVARFGAMAGDRVRLAVFMVAMPLLKRVGRTWPTRHQLRIGGEIVGWQADNDADLAIIEEVFGREVYDLRGICGPEVVVDLGAHVGASVLFFAMRFPKARIVAVEPDPVNFAKLRHNVGSMRQVTLVNAAVSERSGTITLYSAGRLDGWKSSSTRPATRWQAPIDVPSMRLDDLLAGAGITDVDLLKIDIEGAEYDVLKSFAGLASVRTIVGEVHPDLMNGSAREFVDVLSGFRTDLPVVLSRDTNFRADRIEDDPLGRT